MCFSILKIEVPNLITVLKNPPFLHFLADHPFVAETCSLVFDEYMLFWLTEASIVTGIRYTKSQNTSLVSICISYCSKVKEGFYFISLSLAHLHTQPSTNNPVTIFSTVVWMAMMRYAALLSTTFVCAAVIAREIKWLGEDNWENEEVLRG
jgi:hypothetical protein